MAAIHCGYPPFLYDCAFGIIRVNPNQSLVTIKWFELGRFGWAEVEDWLRQSVVGDQLCK